MVSLKERGKMHICCICGKEYVGYGNNPWPVNNDPGARCCEECNFTVVTPERIKNLTMRNSNEDID